ncbi:hypothetical protein [Candidatus Alkanophaga liquidiphilum]
MTCVESAGDGERFAVRLPSFVGRGAHPAFQATTQRRPLLTAMTP